MNCGLGSVYQLLWCMVFGKIRAAQGFLSIMFDTWWNHVVTVTNDCPINEEGSNFMSGLFQVTSSQI